MQCTDFLGFFFSREFRDLFFPVQFPCGNFLIFSDLKFSIGYFFSNDDYYIFYYGKVHIA